MTKSERKKKKKRKQQRRLPQVDKDTPTHHTTSAVDGQLHKSTSGEQEADYKKNISRFKTDFVNLGTIGEGGFGIVYKAKHRLDDQNCAVKRIRIRAKDTKKIIGEVKWLTKLIHDNVVRYCNSWIEYSSDVRYDTSDEHSEVEEEQSDTVGSSIVFAADDGGDAETAEKEPSHNHLGTTHNEPPATECRFLFIQMEYCGNDTLRTYINKGLCKLQKCRLRIFRKILDGLEYIHSRGIIHRDLKPENIFIDRGEERVKIGDFGLATRIGFKKIKPPNKKAVSSSGTENLTTNIGSRMYASPEMLTEESRSSYGKEVDIYSLGVIFFEMSSKPITTGMERAEILSRVRSQEIRFPDDFDELEVAKETNVIRAMLNHDPQQRPSAKQLKQLLRKSSSVPKHNLEKNDIYCALINSILNPSCSHEPEAMPLKDIEDTFVKHCQGVSSSTVLSFKDACGMSLVQFIKRKPNLYHLYREKVETSCHVLDCQLSAYQLFVGAAQMTQKTRL